MSWNQNNHADKRRYKGRDLQRERARLFREQPLCAECAKSGRVTVATIRDHIIPLAEGGQDVPENTQGLCVECHQRKTLAESAKGRGATLKGCDADGVPIDNGHHWRK
jgi:5-methylcytosine-specific restriction protein A